MAAALVPMSAVRREDRGQLPGGDALELYDRRLRDAVVQDPPCEGGRKQ